MFIGSWWASADVPEVAGTVTIRAAKYTLPGFGAVNLHPTTVD
jgi:hypothetical protein